MIPENPRDSSFSLSTFDCFPRAAVPSDFEMKSPTITFFCATYLKPEMLHIHRQITLLPGWDVHVITQRIENLAQFPVASLDVVPRSPWRWASRLRERSMKSGPWQASAREVDTMLHHIQARGSDVLHIFFGNVAVHWLPLLRKIDIPVVVSFHGADVAGAIAGPAYAAARGEVFARADVIACRSTALAERVAAMGADQGKTRVTRTVIPDSKVPLRALSAVASHTILQACRLVPKKGLVTTLHAFARVCKKDATARLTLAGEGPMETELRALAAELGVADRVRFAGFLPQAQLADELARAAIFVHPSESIAGDTEGVPNSMLEAMAAGVPVVATRHGGIVEAVVDGTNGFLVPERDDEMLADRMAVLLEDSDLNARMGCAARDAVQQGYSEDASGAALADLYRTVAGQRKRPTV